MSNLGNGPIGKTIRDYSSTHRLNLQQKLVSMKRWMKLGARKDET